MSEEPAADYTTETLLMSDFVEGAVFYVEEPNRIARVTGTTTMDVQGKTGIERRTVAVMEVTLPTKPIPGLLTATDAKTIAKEILPALKRDKGDKWIEYWGERSVHPLVKDNAHNIWIRDENRWVVETAVLGEEERPNRTKHASSSLGRPLAGAKIDPSYWGKVDK